MKAHILHRLPRVRNQLTEFTKEGFFYWTFVKYGIPLAPGNSSKSLAMKPKVIAVFKIFETCHVVVVASLPYWFSALSHAANLYEADIRVHLCLGISSFSFDPDYIVARLFHRQFLLACSIIPCISDGRLTAEQ